MAMLSVSFADDLILVSASKNDLQRMVTEVIQAFAAVGLEVGADKSHWTSYPGMPGSKLTVGTEKVKWESHLVFVGTILNLGGNSSAAMEHRLSQAEKNVLQVEGTDAESINIEAP